MGRLSESVVLMSSVSEPCADEFRFGSSGTLPGNQRSRIVDMHLSCTSGNKI